MLRTLLLVVALVIIIGIVLVATGVVHLNRDANGNVTATVNPVTVRSEPRNITVPTITTETKQVQVPVVSVGNAQAGNGQ